MGQSIADENADMLSAEGAEWESSVLKCLVRALEENTVARVNRPGFIRSDVEERSVKGGYAFLKVVCPLDLELYRP